MVTSQMLNRIAARLNLLLFDMPVGFKYFAAGLKNSLLRFKT